jgi:hypothetical protein
MPSFTPDNLYLEPFEGDLTIRGWSGGGMTIVTGRTGNGVNVSGSGNNMLRSLTTDSRYIVGFIYQTSLIAANNLPVRFRRSGADQVTLRYDATGAWQFYVGASLIWTGSAGGVPINTLMYVELDVKIDPSAGHIELRVNGSVVHTFTGNTQGGADTLIDEYKTQQATSGGSYLYDDMYFAWGAGAAYLGNIAIKQYAPNADGSYQQYTPDSGSAHFSRVSEKPVSDGDTSYVKDSISGHKDSYSFSSTSPAGTILAVQIHTVAKQDDIGTLQFNNITTNGATDHVGPAKTLTQQYASYDDATLNNPRTAAPWVAADFATDEFGTELV